MMDGPNRPVAAASGDPRKTLKAPFDCVVRRLLEIQTAMSVDTGDPLLLVVPADGDAPAREAVLTAPAAGLIVYIPAKEGQRFKEGQGLVYIL